MDAKNQIAITRKLKYRDKRFERLLTSEARKTPGTFQLHVFVSPFVEPARVYTGSVSEDGHHTTYNLAAFEPAFLAKLGDRLGEPGQVVPGPKDEPGGQTKSPSSRIESPQQLSQVQALYPGPELAAREGATVILESVIMDDGLPTRLKPLYVQWGTGLDIRTFDARIQ